MAREQVKRSWTDLTEESQDRIRDYIERNETVVATELAEDLNLKPQSISAVRANLSR